MPKFEFQRELVEVYYIEADTEERARGRLESGHLDPDETHINDTILIGEQADA